MEDIAKKILIVEDEEAMANALNDALKSTGFKTIHAKNGDAGLKMALDEKPDLILLDILMPKVDGMTLLRQLREDAWGKTAPVIILSNINPDSDAAIKAIVENQPAYYLIKADVKVEDVVEKVKQVLRLA